jgi:hypothetical protein
LLWTKTVEQALGVHPLGDAEWHGLLSTVDRGTEHAGFQHCLPVVLIYQHFPGTQKQQVIVVRVIKPRVPDGAADLRRVAAAFNCLKISDPARTHPASEGVPVNAIRMISRAQ